MEHTHTSAGTSTSTSMTAGTNLAEAWSGITDSYTYYSKIRGYHVYQEILTAIFFHEVFQDLGGIKLQGSGNIPMV